jgi:hypothetical protein
MGYDHMKPNRGVENFYDIQKLHNISENHMSPRFAAAHMKMRLRSCHDPDFYQN